MNTITLTTEIKILAVEPFKKGQYETKNVETVLVQFPRMVMGIPTAENILVHSEVGGLKPGNAKVELKLTAYTNRQNQAELSVKIVGLK